MSYRRRSYKRSYKRSCKRFEEATKEAATREGVIEEGNCSREKEM
jgi:hypothetical protein